MNAYKEWLLAQPVSVQNDILGTDNANRLRNGTLAVDKFSVSQPLTLEQFVSKRKLIADKISTETGKSGTES